MKSLARLDLPDETLLADPQGEPPARGRARPARGGRSVCSSGGRCSHDGPGARVAPDVAKDDGVSRHAAFLLGKIGPRRGPPAARTPSAARRAGSIRSPRPWRRSAGRSWHGSIQAVESPEPRVRRGAALALGQIRPLAPGTVQKLTAGLNDPDPEVKGSLPHRDRLPRSASRESVPAVRALLHDASAEIRIQAIADSLPVGTAR